MSEIGVATMAGQASCHHESADEPALILALWEEHRFRWQGPCELEISVPLTGQVSTATFGVSAGVWLERRWRQTTLDDEVVDAVAASCVEVDGRCELSVFITFADVPAGNRRLDGLRMARDVRAALRHATRTDEAA